MLDFTRCRKELRLSQSALARLSDVKRERICLAELGDVALTVEEHRRITHAIAKEAERIARMLENQRRRTNTETNR